MTQDPTLARLTGAAAAEVVVRALDGAEPASWRVRQVDHRPGSTTTVVYDATLPGSGHQRVVVSAGTEGELTTWRFPDDPELPALATAVDEEAVRALLTPYGLAPGPIRLDVRSYRPRRRAVVEVQAPRRRLFLKVLRPPAVAAMHDRHTLLAAAGVPVPRALGWSEQGLLVLDARPGTTLRARLREGGTPAPDAAALLELLARLPQAACDLPLRRSWTDEADHYARVTGSALPSEAARCRELAAAIRAGTCGTPPDVPSHGDFYEAQLLLDGPTVSGLLDVDTVGPGRRADDLACLLAHVSVLAQMEPAHRASTTALADGWLRAFDRVVDPRDLRARVAGVVLSLATGPLRVQQRDWPEATRARLDLAERWLQRPGLAPRAAG